MVLGALYVAGGAIAGAASSAAGALGLSAVGFTSGGVAAGSIAAGDWQCSNRELICDSTIIRSNWCYYDDSACFCWGWGYSFIAFSVISSLLLKFDQFIIYSRNFSLVQLSRFTFVKSYFLGSKL
jgi:hypothetical protein